ncbi:MAG: SDR family NAD(P)-dependent oxidoreductase [Chlamydiia bacterium]|nr:SDR family NAD(P)-dependent oxidoreductase [Chlamydiia bacterium]
MDFHANKKSQKVILITGASRGLGRVLSSQLSSNHKIYAGIRSKNEIPESKKPNINYVHLDLTKDETISNAVDAIIQSEKRIDVVIHNAGISICGGVDALTMQEVRELFEINFFGALKLNQLVLPFMRARKEGQLVFLSSIRGVESHGYFGVYSASKAALEAVAFDLAVTLWKWNIKVSIVQPGPILTGCKILNGTFFNETENPYPPIPQRQFDWENPQDVVKVIDDLINSENPDFAVQTTATSKIRIAKHLADPSRMDWLMEQRKWVNANS